MTPIDDAIRDAFPGTGLEHATDDDLVRAQRLLSENPDASGLLDRSALTTTEIRNTHGVDLEVPTTLAGLRTQLRERFHTAGAIPSITSSLEA